jgi:ubiquitin carboxyl-terminal hydrolase 7
MALAVRAPPQYACLDHHARSSVVGAARARPLRPRLSPAVPSRRARARAQVDEDILSPMAGEETPLAEDMVPADAPADEGAYTLVGPMLPKSDKGTYTWRVENFTRIRQQKQYSPVFYSGPHAWRLLMYPAGNNSPHLSVYLDVADGQQLPLHWSRQAHFTLAMINHLDPARTVSKDSDHVFHTRANDWGFREFVQLADARDPGNGYLLDDGSLQITCTVEVAWQPSGHVDSKKETGFVGLKNQGATCYMNSLLQTLEQLPCFRKAVYHMPTREDDDAENSIPLALQRIFYKLQHSDTSVSTKQLTKSFGWDTADTFMQHDVQELLRVLVDKLEEKMKGTSVEGTMAHLFEGKLQNYVKCVRVEDESRRDEAFYDLQVGAHASSWQGASRLLLLPPSLSTTAPQRRHSYADPCTLSPNPATCRCP